MKSSIVTKSKIFSAGIIETLNMPKKSHIKLSFCKAIELSTYLDHPILQSGLDVELGHLDLEDELRHHFLGDVGGGEAVEVHETPEGRSHEGAAPGKPDLRVSVTD